MKSEKNAHRLGETTIFTFTKYEKTLNFTTVCTFVNPISGGCKITPCKYLKIQNVRSKVTPWSFRINCGKSKLYISRALEVHFRWFDNRSRDLDETYWSTWLIRFDHICRFWYRKSTKSFKSDPSKWRNYAYSTGFIIFLEVRQLHVLGRSQGHPESRFSVVHKMQ